MRNYLDSENRNIEQIFRDSVKNQKVGFAKYTFSKPSDNGKKEYSKISAVTYYEPLKLLIGIGEYYDNVVLNKKDNLIKKFLSEDDKSRTLSLIEIKNLKDDDKLKNLLVDKNDELFVEKYIYNPNNKNQFLSSIKTNGEGYLNLFFQNGKSSTNFNRMTYFYLNKDWNWLIISSCDLNDVNFVIKKLESEKSKYLNEIVSNTVTWGVIFTLIMVIITTLVSLKIRRIIKKDRDELYLSRENLKKAQEVAAIGSWLYDLNSKTIKWSEEIYNILEIPKNEKPSYEKFFALVDENDKEMVEKNFNETISKRATQHFIFKIIVNDKIKWIENHSTFYEESKKNPYLIRTLQDISEKFERDKKLEEQSQLLFNQSKMAAMGEMLENIAHQWRQPLSAISISASGLKLESEYDLLDKQKLDKGLDDIVNNTTYLSNTIEDFRKYFLKDKEKVYVNIKNIYFDCMNLLKTKFTNKDIVILEELSDVECIVLKNELVQCLMNILNNAYDILKDIKDSEKLLKIELYKKYDNAVILIRDNGGGIDEKIINKIFEPYFTTKHKSQGTGIGLYMTQEIIVKHFNGYIKAYNEEFEYNNKTYKGAVFKLSFPIENEMSDYV